MRRWSGESSWLPQQTPKGPDPTPGEFQFLNLASGVPREAGAASFSSGLPVLGGTRPFFLFGKRSFMSRHCVSPLGVLLMPRLPLVSRMPLEELSCLPVHRGSTLVRRSRVLVRAAKLLDVAAVRRLSVFHVLKVALGEPRVM